MIALLQCTISENFHCGVIVDAADATLDACEVHEHSTIGTTIITSTNSSVDSPAAIKQLQHK